ncbi:serine hydrolase domain-containing protein [Agromyces bauzanensis]
MTGETTPALANGYVAIGYEPVASTLQAIVAESGGGAAVAVYVDGTCVVDAYAGSADSLAASAWSPSTLALMFSCTKALLASCAVRAAMDGELDLDAPVGEYWLGFARNGKARITARDVLSHRAGLPALDTGFTLRDVLDRSAVIRAIELQRPLWEPGTAHAYHAMTFGWMVEEILVRATGHPLAEHFASLCEGGDTWLGVPPAAVGRVARATWDREHSQLVFPPDRPGEPRERRAMTRGVTLGAAFSPELVGPGSGLNDPIQLAAGIPAVGAVSTARSLARIWSTTVTATEGRPALLSSAAIEDATRCLSEGPSALGTPGPWPRWGTGYMLDSEFSPMLSPVSFGHDGAGGQLAFADPARAVGFAFLTNRLRNVDDRRATSLVEALRRSL